MSNVDCHLCGKSTKPTVEGKYRKHNSLTGEGACATSGLIVPGLPPPNEGAVTEVGGHVFRQPAFAGRKLPDKVEMTDLGRELTGRLKEMFYAYNNRRAADNRTAQAHLGPSEIGTACDRRLALTLAGAEPVNPGGDGWAAFVGTCVHDGLAQMFDWANASTGRYVTEMPLTLPSDLVPKGTGDLLDRTLMMFLDHKLMGEWSLNKLATKGPPETYRVQVHTYAYGAQQRGERIEHVAIIGWPRTESSLDDLYVWTEPYDPAIAVNALERVESIARRIPGCTSTPGLHNDGCDCPPVLTVGKSFPVADDCKFCPFHAPGDDRMTRGCPGK